MNFVEIDITDYLKEDFPKVSPKSSEKEKEKYLSIIGVSVDSKGKHLDVNTFSAFFLKYTDLVALENGSLALYNQRKGYYQLNAKNSIAKAVKFFLNQAGNYWAPYFEKIAMQCIEIDVNKVAKALNNGEYINLKNGLLSLEDFKLYPHTPEIFTTSQVPIIYKKQEIPRFEKYLDEITCSDNQLKAIIQEMFGYCLTNSNKAEKTYWLYGNGRNGKSVLCKLLTRLIGEENCSSTSISALGSTFGLSSILGSKVNICTENPSTRFNSEIIKAITSSDKVSVQIKYQDTLSIVLTTKLLFCFNSYPQTTDNTKGLYRRLCIIPFRRTFSVDEVDVYLFSKLEKELSGILCWSIQGLQRLKDNNYQHTHCDACEQALRDYKHFVNPVSNFFDETFEIKEGEWLKRADIYKCYLTYCKINAYEEISVGKFWNLLKSHWADIDFTPKMKKSHGIEMLSGITMRNFNCEGGEQ